MAIEDGNSWELLTPGAKGKPFTDSGWSALADAFEYAIVATRERSGRSSLAGEHLEVV